MVYNNLFISIGTIIIDDIILADGQSSMGNLGGGALHAVMGMRVWTDKVGLVSIIGSDFPDSLSDKLSQYFDTSGFVIRSIPSPRAWQLFESDGKRNEVFRTSYDQMRDNLCKTYEFPKDYRTLDGVHLHCAPKDVPNWCDFLRTRGSPVIIWEPWDLFCIPENRDLFKSYVKQVDIVSPNIEEGYKLTGKSTPHQIAVELIKEGAKIVALRMGSQGSLVASVDGSMVDIPAYPINPIIDVTGAGNSYCGGFVYGYVKTNDFFQAGCYGATSASFSIQQFGGLFSLNNIDVQAQQRLSELLSTIQHNKYRSITFARQKVFDELASTWDQRSLPPDLQNKKSRIVDAGISASGMTILDIGTGTGGILPLIMDHFPACVVEVDISPMMLKQIQSKIKKAQKDNQEKIIHLICADGIKVPLDNESIDVVFCHNVLPHFPDISLAIKEFRRVLKPDGRLIVSHDINREVVNSIHSNHTGIILRKDIIPPLSNLIKIVEQDGWIKLDGEDSEEIYLLVVKKG